MQRHFKNRKTLRGDAEFRAQQLCHNQLLNVLRKHTYILCIPPHTVTWQQEVVRYDLHITEQMKKIHI